MSEYDALLEEAPAAASPYDALLSEPSAYDALLSDATDTPAAPTTAEMSADAEKRYAAATSTAQFEGQGGPTLTIPQRLEAPAIPFPRIPELPPMVRGLIGATGTPQQQQVIKGVEFATGAVNRAADLGEGLVTGENLALLAAGVGAPEIIGKGIAAAFAVPAIKAIPETVSAVTGAKTPGELGGALAGLAGNALIALGTTGHMVDRIAPAIPAAKLKRAVDADLADILSKSPEQVTAETFAPETSPPVAKVETPPVQGQEPVPLRDVLGRVIKPSGIVAKDVNAPTETRPSETISQPATETPNAQQIEIPSPPDGGVRPPEIPRENASVPASEGGARVQPSGQPAVGSEAVGSEGPGAAAATEFPPVATTSTKNAVMQAERAARGADPVLKEARQSNPETLDKAEAAIEQNPNRGQEVVAQINAGTDVRKISVQDEAVLLVEKVRLRNERELQAERASDPNATPEERAVAKQEWESLEGKINEMDQATHASGAEWGRLGQFRQRLLRDDFTFEAMERRARVQKGDALTPEESTRIKEQATRISELEKKLGEATTRDTETAATKTSEQAHTELEREGKKVGKRTPKDAASIEKGLTDGLRAQAKEGNLPTDLRSYFQKLALNFIRAGTHGREAVIDAVHGVVKDIFPGLERNQTRDIISGFGESKALDMEAAKVELRQIKQEAQQIAKIEKIEARQPIPKTGIQRQIPSDEGRALIKAVNEAKRKYGVVVTDPATQLKSAQDAISTRLKNQLRDLAKEMETGEKPPGKTPLEYSEENKALQALRDRVKETLDAVSEKTELTPEQRVRLTEKALERLQEHYEGMVRRGEHTVARTERPTPTSAKIEATRARIAELKEEIQLMRALDEGFHQGKEQTRLEQQGDALLQRLGEGEKPKGAKLEVKDTPEMAEQRLKNEAMRTALAEMKAASPEAKAKKLEAATKAVEASIAELDRQIKTGDVAAKAKPGAVEPPALERLKAERDAMRQYRDELRRALEPKKSPEAIALQAYKTRTANRIAELQDRMARGDFAPKPKRELALDKEATDLRFQIEKVKEQYTKDRFEAQLKARSIPRKILGTGAEVLNTSRAIITSMDVSAVLRQGGFIAFAHPIRAAKAIPDMLRAMASEKEVFRINEEISSRPNAPLYKQSKLYLSEQGNHLLSKMEEAYMSRWATKIPGVGASARAYTTFLNKLRADSFDAMAKSLSKNGKPTLDEAKIISNFINVATGRGSIGLNQAAVGLNTVFFSPRYLASRFQLMAGQPFYGGNARTRTLVAQEYGRFLAGAALVYSLGLASGGTIETDPRSSDFGKIRFGNTRLDPLGGLLQNTVLLSRIKSGEKKNSKGEIIPIRGEGVPYKGENTYDLLARFARTKFSPAIGSGVNVATGKNVVGDPATLGSEIKSLLTPLALRDVLDVMQQHGVPRGTALTILSLFGFGLQTYAPPPEKTEKSSGMQLRL